MPDQDPAALMRFLRTSSHVTRADFFLAKMNQAANAEHELAERLHRITWELAWGLVAELLREHGAELARPLESPRRRRKR